VEIFCRGRIIDYLPRRIVYFVLDDRFQTLVACARIAFAHLLQREECKCV